MIAGAFVSTFAGPTPLALAELNQLEFDPRVWAIGDTLAMAERDGLDGVVLVRVGNAVAIHRAFGWADAEAKTRMTVETGFDIGSIVKPMNFCALLKLEEQGKLALSDTLGKFFPEAPRDKAGITLLQIADHRAGMRDVFGDDYEVVSREAFIQRAMTASLLYRPGTSERYSNSGYSLLAIVIERVTGETFETYVRREILAPAGVTHIGYVQAGWKKDQLAVGYQGKKRWGTPLDHAWASDGPGWNLRGNGGFLGTAADLCQWYEALFDGKVLGPAALAKFYASMAGVSKRVGVPSIGHAGGNGVFNSLQVSYPAADVHLTLFTSTSGQPAEDVYKRFRITLAEMAKAALPDSARR